MPISIPLSLILAALHNDDLSIANQLLTNLTTAPKADSAAATMSSELNEMIKDVFRNLNPRNERIDAFMTNLFRYLSQLDFFIEQSAVNEIQIFLSK